MLCSESTVCKGEMSPVGAHTCSWGKWHWERKLLLVYQGCSTLGVMYMDEPLLCFCCISTAVSSHGDCRERLFLPVEPGVCTLNLGVAVKIWEILFYFPPFWWKLLANKLNVLSKTVLKIFIPNRSLKCLFLHYLSVALVLRGKMTAFSQDGCFWQCWLLGFLQWLQKPVVCVYFQ